MSMIFLLLLKELPRLCWVLPDSYLDSKNKDYGGEPFINGEAVLDDLNYDKEWIRNSARANERNRRNDRHCNFDRSRNFERRRESMQNQDFQNQGVQNSAPNGAIFPPNNMRGLSNNYEGVPPANNNGGMPPIPTTQATWCEYLQMLDGLVTCLIMYIRMLVPLTTMHQTQFKIGAIQTTIETCLLETLLSIESCFPSTK